MAAILANPRWTRRFWLLTVAAATVIALTQVVRSGGGAQAEPSVVVPREPISQANARLLAEGWIPKPDREPLPFERERAGNNLPSLSACSGTGMGFCRYDYRRGHEQLAVVTTPGAAGDGVVHSWFNPN
jgi:hypothetical protein